MLQHEFMALDKLHYIWPQNLVKVSVHIQIVEIQNAPMFKFTKKRFSKEPDAIEGGIFLL